LAIDSWQFGKKEKTSFPTQPLNSTTTFSPTQLLNSSTSQLLQRAETAVGSWQLAIGKKEKTAFPTQPLNSTTKPVSTMQL
jgi:hypothetical protein